MDLAALEARLRQGGVGTIVATLGTTGLGAVDPLPGILDLAIRYGARVHADAAYGGYFTLAANLGNEARAAFDALDRVDSLAIDPHKHGLQPYGCGCIIFRDPGVGPLYRHDSPYTYFTSDELHLGEISLECSRAGAAAVALWATMRLLPLEPGGPFARGLELGREAALDLYRRLDADPRFLPVTEPELDIICFAPSRNTASAVSAASRELFDAAARENLHLALIDLPAAMLHSRWPGVEFDCETVTCLRSCLMKPEHAEWMDASWAILDRAVT
jgi:glutamate/tyrosine decarboxylase-like PLP-dependent enzyme